MKIFDYIDAALYINLDYRTDRRDAVETRCAALNIPVERFEAIQLRLEDIDNPFNDPSWHKKMACTQSHFACIKLAKERGLQNVWIMEDDIKFAPDFAEKAPKVIAELQQLDWDMFFLAESPIEKLCHIPNSW